MSDTSKIQQLETELSDLKDRVQRTALYQAEKDQCEKDYQRSQDRFKIIFERSAIGKKIINNRLEIININPALSTMLGYSEAEMKGKLITDFAHRDFINHWKELQHKLWTTDLPSFNFDTCLIKKDGSTLWAHVTTIQIEDNGNTLGYTILEDVSERKELEHLRDLLREQKQRQLIAETVLNTQEDERKRIAETLHNGLGQLLYGTMLSLNQLKAKDKNADTAAAMQYTQKLLRDCIRECRIIAHDLMPAMLQEHGLKEAVEDICRQMTDSTHFKCDVKGLTKKLNTFLEVAIYRMVQELMMNIVKHANASQALVSISENDIEVVIKVEDNGKGFSWNEISKKGIGMQTIRYKVALLSGKLNIHSKKEEGTKVDICIPKKVN